MKNNFTKIEEEGSEKRRKHSKKHASKSRYFQLGFTIAQTARKMKCIKNCLSRAGKDPEKANFSTKIFFSGIFSAKT